MPQSAESRSPIIAQRDEKQDTPVRDNINYRRHRGACPFYRENWSCEGGSEKQGGQLLYQIICLMDTPPVTPEEQHRCLHSPTVCWRLAADARRNGKNCRNGHAEDEDAPEETEKAADATGA